MPSRSEEKTTIKRRFNRFHRKNRHIFELFVTFARQLMATRRRGSAKLILERMRWEAFVGTENDNLKIENDFSSRYARLAMRKYPELKGFFHTSKLRAE